MAYGLDEIKLFLFEDDMMVYIKIPKESTKNILELISKFSKITGYKTNILKSIIRVSIY